MERVEEKWLKRYQNRSAENMPYIGRIVNKAACLHDFFRKSENHYQAAYTIYIIPTASLSRLDVSKMAFPPLDVSLIMGFFCCFVIQTINNAYSSLGAAIAALKLASKAAIYVCKRWLWPEFTAGGFYKPGWLYWTVFGLGR